MTQIRAASVCLVTGIAVLLATVAAADEIEAEGQDYRATAYFLPSLGESAPEERIDTAHLGMEGFVQYTEWRELDDRIYHVEYRIFDPNDALVTTWLHEFTPDNGMWNTWYNWCLCSERDAPGTWRFEIYVDESLAFRQAIEVKPAPE